MLGAYETDIPSRVGNLVALISHALIPFMLIEVHVFIRFEESPFPCHLLDFTPYGFGIRVQCKTDTVINNSQPHPMKNLHHSLGRIVCISIVASGHLDNVGLLISGIA